MGRDAGASAGGAAAGGLTLPQHVLLPGHQRAKVHFLDVFWLVGGSDGGGLLFLDVVG